MTIIASFSVCILVLFFAFGCCIKLLSVPDKMLKWQMHFFELYGLKRVHMYLVGLVELFGIVAMALGLFAGSLIFVFLGASAIFFSSVGALYFHFRYDEVKYAIPAIVTFTMSAYVMVEAISKYL